MTPDLLRPVALLHGVLAWIAALALLALSTSLVRTREHTRLSRALRLASGLTTSLVAASFATGLLLELPYRAHLRQRLFLASRALGWLFERKLHLSFGALVFVVLALLALLAAGAEDDGEASRSLRKTSRFAYGVAALFSLAACVIGTLVSLRLRF
ncbi:hypothetical protein [Polyangium spumosum]|uniref:DUF420 domain-containing protein n=1 Tax=Polyangium spumosum TaxID=889282 RepID=A0A6N7Q1W8_9BACT|nr:hypothetical protein [Polyangium spumosum]MRG94951.1 hypothetical protein [Polyangium spumosum]